MKCLLAAMDGMTTAAFRSLVFEYGIDGATTEMIGALGFARARRKMKPINAALIMRRPEEKYLAAQIIGSVPEAMAEAARRLEALHRFDAIEINMGCPARKVNASGNGSAILKDPPLAESILRAACGAVNIPVRLKMRLGWDPEHMTAGDIIRRAEDAGVKEIILHGRTREQLYRGEPDITAMRSVCAAVNIPVYANGGVTTAGDARTFLDATEAYGVCIGRAALKAPWIFEDIRTLEAGGQLRAHLLPERIRNLRVFAGRLVEQKKEFFAVCEMRKYVGWWLEGFYDSESLIDRVNHITALEELDSALEEYLNARVREDNIYPIEKVPSLDTMAQPGNHSSLL